jgi:hypothetical protein
VASQGHRRHLRAKSWLENCVENHTLCSSDGEQTLPTRILDLKPLDSEGSIRLVEHVRQHERYAALSHCWGTTPQFTTTKATFLRRKDRIPLGQLTKTFRETVQVTRALGIRYLWVRTPAYNLYVEKC